MVRFCLLPDDAQSRAALEDLSNWGRMGVYQGFLLIRTWHPGLIDMAALRGAVLPGRRSGARKMRDKLPGNLKALISADATTTYDALVELVGDESLIE